MLPVGAANDAVLTPITTTCQAMLHLDSVTKSFGAVRAVDNLSFDVQKGEIFALLGPNGAGKSTTLRMITGILEPDSGTIRRGAPFQNNRLLDAALMAYMPEERGLYREVRISDTIIYFGKLRGMSEQQAREAARYWLDRLELRDRVGEKLAALSKGNQQKVQFIATILHRPALAILDEPFSGFDPINQELFSAVIRELRDEGTTILLSAHQMDLVERIADRILLMREGSAARYGTLEEFRKQAGAAYRVRLTWSEIPTPDTMALLTQFGTVKTSGVTAEVACDDNSGLSALLSLASQSGSLTGVHTEQVSLHQLYLDSFAGDASVQSP